MAVTYSWRLDTNKYAYLLPPDELESGTSVPSEDENEYTEDDYLRYGYLSTTPLRDYFAKSVATKAEELFGKDTTIDNPLGEYQKAFNIMLSKIKMADSEEGYTQIMGDEVIPFVWEGISNYDLLSADEYFNVDAVSCVDLRGVGIKEVKYIGSIPCDKVYSEGGIEELESPVDINGNLNGIYLKGTEAPITYLKEGNNGVYNDETGEITIRQGIPGFTDVYGIYMDDQGDSNGDITEDTVPEKFFIIRNGKMGPQGEKGDTVAAAKDINLGDLEDRIIALEGALNTLQNTTIPAITGALNTLMGENWDEWKNPLAGLTGLVNSLNTQINGDNGLAKRVSELEENGGGENGPGETPGAIEIYQPRITDDNNTIEITNEWGGDAQPYGPNGDNITEQDYNFISGDDGNALYLLGYYFRSKDAGSNTTNRLFAIPNIAVSSKGISIKGDINVIEGKINAKEMYAKEGFYQTTTEDLPSGEISIYQDNANNGQ